MWKQQFLPTSSEHIYLPSDRMDDLRCWHQHLLGSFVLSNNVNSLVRLNCSWLSLIFSHLSSHVYTSLTAPLNVHHCNGMHFTSASNQIAIRYTQYGPFSVKILPINSLPTHQAEYHLFPFHLFSAVHSNNPIHIRLHNVCRKASNTQRQKQFCSRYSHTHTIETTAHTHSQLTFPWG